MQNPPAKVWEWRVDGKTYFYLPSGCCDQLDHLYNSSCEVICAPSGGIVGTGDGNCPEFEGDIQRTLIWEDDRD